MRTPKILATLVCLLAAAFAVHAGNAPDSPAPKPNPADAPALETAIFAGGCFWCVESDFDAVDGVVSTTSGYTGGSEPDPTYQQVSSGSTGHAEAVSIEYDPARVSYAQLLDVFWHSIDPTVRNAQFCDHGPQYRSAIFVLNDEQRALALESKAALEKSKPFDAEIVTEIVAAGAFHPAEAYHQDYHRKNPLRYRYYRSGCGRDRRLEQLWGDQAITH